MQILECGRQEGPERPLHSNGLSLGEAQEVGATDAPHGAGLRGVQGDQVELWEPVRLISSSPAQARSRKVGAVPPGLRCGGGPDSREREVYVEW